MTQPPLRPSRWAVGVAVVVTVGVLVWIGLEMRPEGPPWRIRPALIVRHSGRPTGDFNDPRFSRSELVSLDKLTGQLRREGFTDGIGLAEGLPPCDAIVVPTEPVEMKTPDDPHGVRTVTDGVWEVAFADYCGPSGVTISNHSQKVFHDIRVDGHAHTKGCMAPKRGVVCATCFDPSPRSKEEPLQSHVIVIDYKSGKELGLLKMPISQFDALAISRDQKWLYVGFGDGSVRRFSLDNLFPPRKKTGWFAK